jgi:hypothetical protein
MRRVLVLGCVMCSACTQPATTGSPGPAPQTGAGMVAPPAQNPAGQAAPANPQPSAAGAAGKATTTPAAGMMATAPADAGAPVVDASVIVDASSADAAPSDASATDAAALDAQAGDAATTDDPMQFGKDLNMLFMDVPCTSDTRAPLAQMATCQHPPNTQHIEKPVTFGGKPGTTYDVTLRVRGIWEPTSIMNGERPDMKLPLTIGGKVTGGSGSSSDAINYQQYYILVSEPKQQYWLNDYRYVAHDIHKEDYQANIKVGGGATVTVVMNDGNDHEIANWTKDFFMDVPPYDKAPSLGQSLRLDVTKIAVAP